MRMKFFTDHRINMRGWMSSLNITDDVDVEYDRYQTPSPYDHAAAFEARDVLELMFKDPRLSPAHIQTILLVCHEGMSMDEAAEALGICSGTVRSRVHRARAVMKEYT